MFPLRYPTDTNDRSRKGTASRKSSAQTRTPTLSPKQIQSDTHSNQHINDDYSIDSLDTNSDANDQEHYLRNELKQLNSIRQRLANIESSVSPRLNRMDEKYQYWEEENQVKYQKFIFILALRKHGKFVRHCFII